MATRTDNPVTLTPEQVTVVLEALHEHARHSYTFWRNQRNQQATRTHAKQQADQAMIVRDAIVSSMYTWS
jgi:hypothetical protein